jgi:small-conductance mechanosensitive channel
MCVPGDVVESHGHTTGGVSCMRFDWFTLYPWLSPFLIIALGLVAGIFVEKIVLQKIRLLTTRTAWAGDEILANSLRGMPFFWLTAAGVHIAVSGLDIPEKWLLLIKKTILVVVIFSITAVAARISTGFVDHYSKKVSGAFISTTIFVNLTRVIVYILGFLVILDTIGISITPILTALGVGGLAVALALQDTLSNLFAGIHVIASGQIRPNDYVRLSTGEEGYVTDITWRYTSIRSLPNNRIIVPNVKLASAIMTNFELPEKNMAVLVEVGVGYGSDLEKVEKVTIETARKTMEEVPGGVSGFRPFIRYHTYGDFSIIFTVILRVKEYVDQYLIKHEFIKRLYEAYRQQGIEIPFPIRTVFIEGQS